MMRTPEDYRKNPLYGTDLNKKASQVVGDLRNKFTETRNMLSDIQSGFPGVKEHLDPLEGLLTCGISYLFHHIEDLKKIEIEKDDRERGKSLSFRSRGIGSDTCSCFVCGEPPPKVFFSNISAFVKTKEEGEEIKSWFNGQAWLDYRPSEPNWIQLKIGACEKHLPNLEALDKIVSQYYVIRKIDIEEVLKLDKIEENAK